MRILLLNDDALPEARGGAAVMAEHLRHAFAERGHTVTLLTTHQDAARPAEERTKDDGGEVIRLFVPEPGIERHRRAVRRTPLSHTLERLFGELQPDVVHAHNLHRFLTYDALRIARAHTPRVFLTAHDAFAVSFTRVGGPRYESSVLHGTPFHLHWWENLRVAGRTYAPLRNARIRAILRKNVSAVLCCSEAVRAFLSAHGISRTQTLHNGIPLPPPAPASPSNAPSILFAGRISGDKGIGVLLRAMEHVVAALPSAQLVIAGDAARLEPSLAGIPPAVRKALRSTGWLTPEALRAVYAACDVVTVPSVYLDNFPMITLEAMAQGKPVVGSCFGGIREAIDDGVTGLVVNPHDTRAFADALLTLLRDPSLCARMGRAAREKAEREFSLEAHVRSLLDLYGT